MPMYCVYAVFTVYCSAQSTFWTLAWLYPLGPSKFVNLLDFEVLCMELWKGSFYFSQWHFSCTQMAVHYSGCQNVARFCYACIKETRNLPNSHTRCSVVKCIYSHASSITASVMAWDKDNKMHSNSRHPHRHTKRIHTLARFMFPPLSCLYQSASASGQLCSPEHRKNRVKKNPVLWLIKHGHPAVLSLPSHAVLHTLLLSLTL